VAAGAIQEATLRHDLTKSLEIEWEHSGRHCHRVMDVPEPVTQDFSQCHLEITGRTVRR
jgi:hypothetical protein